MTDDLLGPGWTPYGKRILAETYDVTDLLGVGENVIGAVLGDGWYRGRLGWERETRSQPYGSQAGAARPAGADPRGRDDVDRRDR